MTKTQSDKTAMAKAGFSPARRSPRRIIMNIMSTGKAVGKTRLALTAPKPVGYIAVEAGGGEGVLDQFITNGSDEFDGIQVANIRMEQPEYPAREDFKPGHEGDKEHQSAVSEAIQNAAAPALDKFYEAYYLSIETMPTTIIDTGTDAYELMRLAEFGRLERVPQLAYGQLNRQVATLFDDAYSQKGNVIWIHHMKEKWINEQTEKGLKSTPSGEYKMDGSKVVMDKCQAVIELWRENLTEDTINDATGRLVRFHGQIVDSRHFADAIGTHLKDDDLTFANLAMAMIPGSSLPDWQ